MADTTRSRVIKAQGFTPTSRLRTWTESPDGISAIRTIDSDLSSAAISLDGIQVTVSENHPDWNSSFKKGSFRGDLGGEFSTSKTWTVINGGPLHIHGGTPVPGDPLERVSMFDYHGPVLPREPSELEHPRPDPTSRDKLDELGTTAIARCSPTNPVADLTTAIGEIVNEGIPKLIGSGLKGLRSLAPGQRRKALGDEYLNYQYGWVPFVSDLRSISKGIIDSDKIIRQYDRDSNKLVRRQYHFPVITESSYETVAGPANPWWSPSTSAAYNLDIVNTAKVIRERKLIRRRWFSGGFSYYIPKPGSTGTDAVARQVILAKKTLGLRLTPDAVWNLAPWSWAVDWFSNTGDFLKNLDASIIDGQVLQYGYMMEHCSIVDTYTFTGQHNLKVGQPVPSVVCSFESKIRIRATPYGFGLSWDGLSAFQQSILAALGLSFSGKGGGKHS